MPYRIYVTADIGEQALRRLRERGWEVEVHDAVEAPAYETILEKVSAGYDALITTFRDRIDARVFEAGAAAHLKIVAQYAVGVDNIDRAAATRHRIPFSNTADVLTEATAEWAFFLMGCVARRTYPSEETVRRGRWSTWHPYQPWLGDGVTGKTLAVIGLGRIGKSVVKKAVGFDMDVLAHNAGREDLRFVNSIRRIMAVRFSEGLTRRQQRIECVSLEDALRQADFVSLHVPLLRPGESSTPTLCLIDESRLRLMKSSAYLVNTARGPVVDEKALARALREGWIAGAALDVFEKEPLPGDSPLLDESLTFKLRLFNHLGSATCDTRLSPDPDVGMAGRAVQAVIDVLEGGYGGDPRRMPFVVNKEAFGA